MSTAKRTPPRRPVRLSRRGLLTKQKMAVLAAGGAQGEAVWAELVRTMDEAYAELAQYEAALEEKNAELAESREFTLSVLASMSDVVAVCDNEGRVQEANRALGHLLGRKPRDLQGTPIMELFADEESQRRAHCLVAKGRPGIVQDCEVSLRARDGTPVPVTLNCTPRYSRAGKVLGLVVVGRPVGELRRTYRELAQAHAELKRTQTQLLQSEKLASLGRLVAGVAHELNNPISFVLGNVHVLEKYLKRVRAYLDALHTGAPEKKLAALRAELKIDHVMADLDSLLAGTVEGAERTRQIVDGLKRFAAPGREPEEAVDLTEVLRRAAHWVERGTGTKMRVEFDLPGELRAWGSASQLQQVAVNIVQNAVDATASAASPRLRVSGRVERGTVRVTFHDNGPGVPAEHLARVFDPFFTTKSVGKGTGLGLSISYGIAERHGGRLAAANHPDGGAVFTLTLPTGAAAGARPRKAASA
ncbi:MAG: ATP-binding protein [Burkholderiales bacterium]|jgi:two-component system sensor histidine kinase HupT/HoxJ|nr:ATP-binding protein [Burkholderiales bacterium]